MNAETIINMADEEFQEMAALVLSQMAQRGYIINKGIFELMDDCELSEVETNIGQYNSFDR